MAFRVEMSAAAERDAESILEWLISQQAEGNGFRWYEGMRKTIASLAGLTLRCALAPENEAFEYEVRQLLYGRYRILFTVESNTVTILHIRHGRRKPLAH